MALAKDVQNESRTTGTTSYSYTGPNVSASATVLVVTLLFGNPSSTTLPTGISVTWDSGGTNQAMTLFGSGITSNAGSSSVAGYIYYLLSPTSGAKTLAVSWTNVQGLYVETTSYTGGDTSTPLANLSSNTATSGTTITVTQSPSTGAGDLILSGSTYSGGSGVSTTSDDNGGSQDFLDNGGLCGAAGRSSGAGGTTFTYNYLTTIPNSVALSVAIKAAAAGGSTSTGMGLLTMGVGR